MQLNSTNPQHVPATEKALAVLHHFLWLSVIAHPSSCKPSQLSFPVQNNPVSFVPQGPAANPHLGKNQISHRVLSPI